MGSLEDKVIELFSKNKRTYKNFQYTVPSPSTYPFQWLWDSCFHAIILSHFNVGDAKKELESLISRQFQNGMIPHIIYWDKNGHESFPNINWGKDGTSTITQPPMIALAAWRIYSKTGDKVFLEKIYPSLKKFFEYILKDRDPRGHHLAGIINPDESGEDDSPRFDTLLDLQPKHSLEENFQRRLALVEENKKCNFDAPFCMKNFFWVKDVPFNSILVENLRIMSDVASELRLDQDSDYFLDQSKMVKGAMRKLMLEEGVFYSTYGTDYKKIKVITWAIFTPLFAGIATKKEADDLVNNYLKNKEEFNLDFLIPTVSKKEQGFDPKTLWRGPVWIGPNWFIYQGLKRYGFFDEAQKLKESSLNLIEKTGFREHFDPFTGEGQGAEDFTWGGLVLDME